MAACRGEHADAAAFVNPKLCRANTQPLHHTDARVHLAHISYITDIHASQIDHGASFMLFFACWLFLIAIVVAGGSISFSLESMSDLRHVCKVFFLKYLISPAYAAVSTSVYVLRLLMDLPSTTQFIHRVEAKRPFDNAMINWILSNPPRTVDTIEQQRRKLFAESDHVFFLFL
jgi:hypothetical protein